jgi:hypothetical protein
MTLWASAWASTNSPSAATAIAIGQAGCRPRSSVCAAYRSMSSSIRLAECCSSHHLRIADHAKDALVSVSCSCGGTATLYEEGAQATTSIALLSQKVALFRPKGRIQLTDLRSRYRA